LDLKSAKKGEATYSINMVIDPDYTQKGYALKFLWEALAANKMSGYKFYYAKVTSPQTLDIFCKLGATIVSEVKF
jgi:hypothetical protein